MNKNLLLATDVYKLSHMSAYPPGTTKIYSYLVARSDKKLPDVVFYGLQYYLKEYLSRAVTHADVDEFLEYRKNVLGGTPKDIEDKARALADLGYIPLEIKAVEEGTVLPVKNVLMTMTNTLPEFFWVVGFFESLLLKVWNTSTVASYGYKLHSLTKKFSDSTCDDGGHLPFQIHDFGYRGVSTEETAEVSGSAALIGSLGTDTLTAVKFAKTYYAATEPVGLSVFATEHSVVMAYGQDNELASFERVLDLNPGGIISVVSDTYNLWNVLTNFTDVLHNKILARDGKIVFRPDSGDPEKVICGDPSAPEGSPERKGAIVILAEKFGTTYNSKGYMLLNPKIGLIYGDGMYYERFERILTNLQEMGYASSNLVIGVGGLLLQQHNRDDQGYAIKATYAEVDGEVRELLKDPVTDPGKRSHKGLIKLSIDAYGNYVTKDQCTWDEEKQGLLQTVFLNGKVVKEVTFDQVRKNAKVK